MHARRAWRLRIPWNGSRRAARLKGRDAHQPAAPYFALRRACLRRQRGCNMGERVRHTVRRVRLDGARCGDRGRGRCAPPSS
jgi:hypothetical protein